MKIGTLAVCLAITAAAQTVATVQIADGSRFNSAPELYGDEAQDVFTKIKNFAVRAPGVPNVSSASVYVKQPVTGNFYETGHPAKAYLYTLCDAKSDCPYQGIILTSEKNAAGKTSELLNCLYPSRNDELLVTIKDPNGSGLDDLALVSHDDGRSEVHILRFAGQKLTPVGRRVIYDLNGEPAFRSKLSVGRSPDGQQQFYEERETITGKGWTPSPVQPIKLDADDTKYYWSRPRNSIFKHLVFLTFVVQIVGFFVLFGFVVYEIFIASDAPDEDDEPTESEPDGAKKKAQKKPNLPKLDPINCLSCGAPVPLAEGEMTCPSCGTKTKAPEDYFDVLRSREAIRAKIPAAAAYLSRASILTSPWMRSLLVLLVVWLGVAIVALFLQSSRDHFKPYQDFMFGETGHEFIPLFGAFTSAFWIFSLGFGVLIWSPRIKRNLPKIELGENVGKAESDSCPQCGGGIGYRADDLATVCGYCGVEVYRANLAWKLHNLTNTANEKAEFSLLDAKKAAADAVDEVVGAPKVFMILLILLAILIGVLWLLSSIYDQLPSGLRDAIDFIGDLIDLFS